MMVIGLPGKKLLTVKHPPQGLPGFQGDPSTPRTCNLIEEF